jgi:DnaD/phage-associated family protein|nr:MAG TPA: DNA polymerase [Caudoviricetes sp.]
MKTEKSGGRPKKETSGFEKEKTIGFQNTKSKTKPNVNDNENVNVNGNDNDNEDVSDSCVDGLQKIIDFYNENIGMITSYGIEILSDYAKEMSADLIILAMKKSVEANKRTIQYIKGILNNWSKKGIKTVLQAEQEDEQFRRKSELGTNEREKELEEWLNECK